MARRHCLTVLLTKPKDRLQESTMLEEPMKSLILESTIAFNEPPCSAVCPAARSPLTLRPQLSWSHLQFNGSTSLGCIGLMLHRAVGQVPRC